MKPMLVAGLLAIVGVAAAGVYWGPDQYRIYQGKAALADTLLDPESAIYSGVFVHGDYVCGNVNARNRFGGMVGKKLFMVHRSGRVDLEPESDTGGWDLWVKSYELLCGLPKGGAFQAP